MRGQVARSTRRPGTLAPAASGCLRWRMSPPPADISPPQRGQPGGGRGDVCRTRRRTPGLRENKYFESTFHQTHLHCDKVVFVSTTSSIDELLTSPRLKIEEESWHESVARPSLHGKLTNWVDRGRSQVSGKVDVIKLISKIIKEGCYVPRFFG